MVIGPCRAPQQCIHNPVCNVTVNVLLEPCGYVGVCVANIAKRYSPPVGVLMLKLARSLVFSLALLGGVTAVFAAAPTPTEACCKAPSPVHVRGHSTKGGSFVQPHVRTGPDSTQRNNWSSKGNTNPYTGKAGSKTARR